MITANTPPSAATRGWLVALSILYMAVYLPATAELAIYHGDERFYTDGALAMLRSGDWTTAATASGVPRFNKPMLDYWLVAGAFRVFGVGAAASRLPSLLAGLFTAWVVWMAARRAHPDEDVALVAGALVLANVELGVLARRATPDTILAASTTASLTGFLLLAQGRGASGAAIAAWLGAGAGVAAKGIPGIAAAVFGLVAWTAAGAGRAPARSVFRPAPIAAAAAVALAGTLPPFVRHGATAMVGLYDDQVTVRGVASSLPAALAHWCTYAGMTALDFVPWSVLAAIAVAMAPGAVAAALREGRYVARYAAAWWLGLSIVLAAVDFVRPRYLAPAYPLLAIPLASVLLAAARDPVGGWVFPAVLRLTGLVVAVLGVPLVLPGALLDRRLALAGVVWVAAGTLALRAPAADTPAADARQTLLGLVALAMLLFGTSACFVHPVFSPAAEPSTARALLALGPDGERAVGLGLTDNMAGKLRLASGGRVPLAELPPAALADPPANRVLVVRARAAAALERRGYLVHSAGVAYERVGPLDVLGSLMSADRAAALASRRQDLFIAVPPGVAHGPARRSSSAP